jgi:hypothetical protein
MVSSDQLRASADRLLQEAKAIAEASDRKRPSLPLHRPVPVTSVPNREPQDLETLWADLILLYHAARDYQEHGGANLKEVQERIRRVGATAVVTR